MGDLFDDPKLLIREARLHIQDFKTACKPFFDGTTSERIVEENPKTGNAVVKIRYLFPNREFSDRARTLAFNIAHNLRLALDQAFLISVEAITGVEENILTFPIRTNPTDLNSTLNVPRI